MQGILPSEAQTLLQATDIKNLPTAISDEVERALLKLWQGEKLIEDDLYLDITPAELAALWSVTHRRPIRVDTARQILLRRTGARGEQIKPSRQWGSGPSVRRLYRLGDVWQVQIQERTAKSGGRP